MRVAICGAGGFLGTHLSRGLVAKGHEVIRMGREHFEDINNLCYCLDGCHAIINVCGAPIVGRWDESYKHELYISRIETTKLLLKAIGQLLSQKPMLFLSISSAGIYKPNMSHDDDSTQYDTSYLALLAKEWENEAFKAEDHGMRVVILRSGAVLGEGGGILEEVKNAFKFGFGMVPGSGKQSFPWIHVDDLLEVCEWVLEDEGMYGVYNLVSPEAVTMNSFFRSVRKIMGRPFNVPMPKKMLQWRYGEGGEHLLRGADVKPTRLSSLGYVFSYEKLDKALEKVF